MVNRMQSFATFFMSRDVDELRTPTHACTSCAEQKEGEEGLLDHARMKLERVHEQGGMDVFRRARLLFHADARRRLPAQSERSISFP